MDVCAESIVVDGWIVEGATWGTVYVKGPDRGGGWRDHVEFSVTDGEIDIEPDQSCSYPCGHRIPVKVMVAAFEMWRTVTKQSQEGDFPVKVD